MRFEYSDVVNSAGAISMAMTLYNSAHGNFLNNAPICCIGAGCYALGKCGNDKIYDLGYTIVFASAISFPASILSYTILAVGPDHPATKITVFIGGLFLTCKIGNTIVKGSFQEQDFLIAIR